MRKRALRYLLLPSLLLWSAPALAQIDDATPLSLGQPITGSLDGTDRIYAARGTPSEFYRVTAPAGTSVEIRLTSDLFDTYLVAMTSSGTVIAEDDDSAGDLDSRVRVMVPPDGVVILAATAFAGSPGQPFGAFQIVATERHLSPLSYSEISGDSTTRGTLAQGDGMAQSGAFADGYVVELSAGSPVNITASSGTVDTTLLVIAPTGEPMAQNDDWGGGTDSFVALTPPITGSYRIIVSSWTEGQTGDYTLTLAPGAFGLTQTPAVPIELDRLVSGRLDVTDPLSNRGGYSDTYSFSGDGGQMVDIRLSSTDFDAYLILTDANGAEILSDDDTGGELNSRVRTALPGTGDYRLVATSYSSGSIGAYVVSVELAEARPVRPQRLRLGAEVEGTLDENDAQSISGYGPVDVFTYDGEAGQRLSIAVEGHGSMWVNVTAPTGEMVYASGGGMGGPMYYDDMGYSEGYDPTLTQPSSTASVWTLPLTGTYTIAVQTGSTEGGRYVLRATEATDAVVEATAIDVGDSVTAQFAAGQPLHPVRGNYVHTYGLTLRESSRIELAMDSDSIDPVLELTTADGVRISENDDAVGTNSRIQVTLPPGEYRIWATEWSFAEGSYTISVRALSDAPIAVEPIRVGDRVVASLDETDAHSVIRGQPSDYYVVSGTAGQPITVSMTTEMFDAYLILIAPNGEILGEDDDSGGNLNPRLSLTLPVAGDYRLIATSYTAGAGAYQLEITEGLTDVGTVIGPEL